MNDILNICLTLTNEFGKRSRLYDLRAGVWVEDGEKKFSDCPSKPLNDCCSVDLFLLYPRRIISNILIIL